jgi:hypothetical protein
MPPILNNQPVDIKEFKLFMGPRENGQGAGGKILFTGGKKCPGVKRLRLDIRGEGILYDPKFLTPQTGKFGPLMKFASSHPRNAAMSAIGPGFPDLLNPDDSFIRSRASTGNP